MGCKDDSVGVIGVGVAHVGSAAAAVDGDGNEGLGSMKDEGGADSAGVVFPVADAASIGLGEATGGGLLALSGFLGSGSGLSARI